jgi:mTERF domain-containing protein
LGVDLSVWEDNVYGSENMEIALRLNFDVDVKPIMLWLMEKGVDIREQAALFTRNPQIFKKTLDEMNNAIEYLKSKDFARQGIKEILIGSHGRWLNFSVVEIDSKLGYFQRNFGLSGNEVRKLSMKEPNLIIWTGAPFQ